MPTSVTCPDTRALQEYLLGRTSEHEARDLEKHVSDCSACAVKLNELMNQDGLTQPSPSFVHPVEVGGEVEALIGRLCERKTELASPSGTAPPETPEARPTLTGYEILRVLGRGGMGVVYEARQMNLDRVVAIKMIRHGDLASPEELARFHREARAVARLQHPNIVQIYEANQQQGRPYLALEYVAGGSLAQFKGTPQPARPAAQFVEILARAMHYAHEHGIIHRDLKPGNILLVGTAVVTGEWSGEDTTHHSPLTTHQPKITDFGLAKKLDGSSAKTASGVIAGTPSYMAPEQIDKSHAIGPAADIYAMGAILYELLTGRPPFKAAQMWDTVSQVLHEDPVAPSEFQPKLKGDLETICLKCLQKEPRKRYASALELAEDLRRFLDRSPIAARRTGVIERSWRWCRRNPAVASLSAGIALALLAGTFSAGFYAFQAGKRAKEAEAALHQRDEAEKQRAALETRLREVEGRIMSRFVNFVKENPDAAKLETRKLLEKFLKTKETDPELRRDLKERKELAASFPGEQFQLGSLETTINMMGD